MGRTEYDPVRRKAVRKRTAVSAVLIFLLIPAILLLSTFLEDGSLYMLGSLSVIICSMAPFFMVFERRKPKAREIVLIAMMSAITVAAHMFFHVTVPLQIGTAMVIIAGISMGPEAGFLVGALSRFICNFYMGQGLWTPWQMFCWGLLGFLAGLAFNKADLTKTTDEAKSHSFRVILGPVLCMVAAEAAAFITFLLWPGKEALQLTGGTVSGFFEAMQQAGGVQGALNVLGTAVGWRFYAFGAAGLIAGILLQRKRLPADNLTLTVFTFFTTVILYGGLMNICAMFTSAGIPGGGGISWNTLRLLYITGLPYDLAHGAAAALCIFLIGNPLIRKIERIKIKYGIYK